MSSLKSKAARLLCQPRENAPSLSIKPELSVRDPPPHPGAGGIWPVPPLPAPPTHPSSGCPLDRKGAEPGREELGTLNYIRT